MAQPTPKKGSFKDLVGCALDVIIPCTGEEVCYRPRAGGAFDIPAVFDENFQIVDPDTEEVVSSQQPGIGVKLANIPFVPTQDDRVSIGRRTFKVTDVQEDGQGGASILMNELD